MNFINKTATVASFTEKSMEVCGADFIEKQKNSVLIFTTTVSSQANIAKKTVKLNYYVSHRLCGESY